MRLLYRVRQFWQALDAQPDPDQLRKANALLTPAQLTLFVGMQPSEQAHALKVLYKLLDQGENHPDLLAAALLHDCGKQRSPLNPLERSWVVLIRKLFPGRAAAWGRADLRSTGELRGWRRWMAVAEQHPAWGAEMARQAGATPLLQALIRRHQEPIGESHPDNLEDELLHRLQVVDNDS